MRHKIVEALKWTVAGIIVAPVAIILAIAAAIGCAYALTIGFFYNVTEEWR